MTEMRQIKCLCGHLLVLHGGQDMACVAADCACDSFVRKLRAVLCGCGEVHTADERCG